MNAQVLAKQRAHIQRRQMPDLLTFMAKAAPTDADMGQESSSPDVAALADVPCRVGTPRQSARENAAPGQVQAAIAVDLFVPFDTARPPESDYVLITTQDDRRIEIGGSIPVSEQQVLKIEGTEIR